LQRRIDRVTMQRGSMRRGSPGPPLAVALSTLALLAACTSIVGFPDVPGIADASGGAASTGKADAHAHDASKRVDAAHHDASKRADVSTGCSTGEQRCVAGTYQTCVADAWGSPSPCATQSCAADGSGCGGATTAATSCDQAAVTHTTAGISDCGAKGTESCCQSLEVTGGTYFRVYATTGGPATGESAPATISGFRLDTYPVTVGRFRQYVTYLTTGGGSTPVAGSGKHAHLNDGQGLVADGNPVSGYGDPRGAGGVGR